MSYEGLIFHLQQNLILLDMFYDFLNHRKQIAVLIFQASYSAKANAEVPLGFRFPADNYMFKINNRNTRTRCEICSKLTIETPERRQWCRSGVFIVKFEHISHLVLVFLILKLSR